MSALCGCARFVCACMLVCCIFLMCVYCVYMYVCYMLLNVLHVCDSVIWLCVCVCVYVFALCIFSTLVCVKCLCHVCILCGSSSFVNTCILII